MEWSSSNDNLILISSEGNTATFRKNGNGESIIQCNIFINALNISLQHLVWLGVPSTPIDIVGPNNFYRLAPNTQYHFSLVTDNINPDNDIEWRVKMGSIIHGQGTGSVTVVTANIPKVGSFSISAKVGNSCGWSPSYIKAGMIDGGLGPFSLSPNPATDMVTVKTDEEQLSSDGASVQGGSRGSRGEPYEIQLWSSSAMLSRYTTDHPVYTIPVSGLPAGIYFVRVVKDGQTHTKKLIKK